MHALFAEGAAPVSLAHADIVVCNQHKAVDLPHEWWTDTFHDTVVSIGRTVLVLQPWEAPLPLTRSWCLVCLHDTLLPQGFKC
jgi:hypothetical protein